MTETNGDKSGLRQRAITALILAPIVISGLFLLPPLGFAWFFGGILVIGAWEWANMAGITDMPGRVVYAAMLGLMMFVVHALPAAAVLFAALLWWGLAFWLVIKFPRQTRWWTTRLVRLVMGLFVLLPAWKGLVFLRSGDIHLGGLTNNFLLILYCFFVVWVADIGAYFAGRAWGKAKLAPAVSPGKSWAGVWGGVAATSLLALMVGNGLGLEWPAVLALLAATLITTAVSVLGDLLESMLKRFRGIKDSSQLLPGHGGVMDRIDSLTAAIPVFALCLLWLGWLS